MDNNRRPKKAGLVSFSCHPGSESQPHTAVTRAARSSQIVSCDQVLRDVENSIESGECDRIIQSLLADQPDQMLGLADTPSTQKNNVLWRALIFPLPGRCESENAHQGLAVDILHADYTDARHSEVKQTPQQTSRIPQQADRTSNPSSYQHTTPTPGISKENGGSHDQS